MNSAGNPEQNRLRTVYDGYESDAKRWSRATPANAISERERLAVAVDAISRRHLMPIDEAVVLDIGCGSGVVLEDLLEWGLAAERAHGIDLLDDRAAAAAERLPQADIRAGDASELPWADESMDYVVLYTVLSSILDRRLQHAICGEVGRVLRPGGGVLWYDMRVPNPRNRNIVPVTSRRLAELFPGWVFDLRRVTVLPQLSRPMGSHATWAYPRLSSVPWLLTHLAGLIQKPDDGR